MFSKRWGTPVAVNLLSGLFSTIVMVLAFQLTSGDAGKYFSVVLALAISTTTISYLLVFPALIKLRYSHPEGFAGQRGAFELSQFVPLAVLLALGLLFYASGARTRAQEVDVPLLEPVEAPAPA